MIKMPLISVIVPVYNTEKFLIQSIESLLAQSFENFEIILINDGSTDNSDEICKSFEKKDKRIRYYKQENRGIGAVRNRALKLIKGDYVIHVDSDDYVEPDFLECLHKKIVDMQADLVYCDFYRFNDNLKWIDKQYSNLTSDDIIQKILTESFFGGLWNKLIKTSVFIDNDIQISENLSMYEDLLFVVQVLTNCNKICYVNKPLYNYRENLFSISYNRNLKTFESAFFVIEQLEKKFSTVSQNQYALIDFKLLIKRDVLLFGQKHKLKNVYPEVDKYIYKSKVLTNFQKSCLILQYLQMNFLVKILLRLRKTAKKTF
nr:glycosyltransferase family 2 protein [uncultured Flavobacterium sp.]